MRLSRRGVWIGVLGFVTFLSLGALVLVWLLISTEWGTEQVWERIQLRLPAGLRIEEVRGTLRGPMEFGGLTFEGSQARMSVERVRVRMTLLPLLRRTVSVRWIEVGDVAVALVPGPPREAEEPRTPLPSVVLPMRVVLGEAVVRRITLTTGRDGEAQRRLDSLFVERLSFRDRLELQSLTMVGPIGRLALSGWIDTQGEYPFSAEVDAALDLPEHGPVEGHLSISGNLETSTVLAVTTAPVAAELSAILMDPRRERRFEAELSIPEADAKQFRAEWPEVRGGGTIFASGTLDSLQARGAFQLDLPQTGPVTLEMGLLRHGSEVEIDEFQAVNRGSRIDAKGRIILTDSEPELALVVDWRNLRWPLQGAAEFTSARGTLGVRGTTSAYRVVMEGAGTRADGLSANIALTGHGTREQLTLDDFRTRALDGRILATGDVAWTPHIRWDLRIGGEELNPSSLMADPSQWAGSLAVQGHTRGESRSGITKGEVFLNHLGGVLRDEEVVATGSAAFQTDQNSTGTGPARYRVSLRAIELDWGPNHLSAEGAITDTLDLAFNLSAPDLGVAVPGAGGQVEVEGSLKGPRSSPQLWVKALGTNLAFRDAAVGFVDLEVDVDSKAGGVVAVGGSATQLQLQGMEVLDSLTLDLKGAPEAHRLAARLYGPPGVLDLAANGGLQDLVWSGVLEALDVAADPWGDWTLLQSGRATVSARSAELDETCLGSDSSRLCLKGSWRAEGATAFTTSVHGLELNRFENSFPDGWTVAGVLNAEATVQLAEDRGLLARAEGEMDSFRMGYPTGQGQRELTFSGVRLEGAVDEGGARAGGGMQVLVEGGTDVANLDGRITMPGYTHLGMELPAQAISGELQGRITDFSALEALIPDVEEVAADLTIGVDISGTVGNPELRGEARLAEGSLNLPGLGLAVRDIEMVARGEGLEGIRLEGRLRSGPGVVEITGNVPLVPSSSSPARLLIRGESFQAADLPEVSMWISPDLQVSALPERVDVTGQVRIPRARVELTELPASAVPPSKDVVFLEDSASANPRGPAIHTNIRVVLGDSVSFHGFGFSAQPKGSVLATDTPDRATTGTGEVTLTGGRYRAYGQDLTMDRGRILFAGGPIDNPGLDMRATRTARDGVVAGLDIGGTLRRPEVTLFSEPVMMQSDVLGYIILGHPLGSASASEGSRVANAASSLGLKGGNLLASRIGQRFGLSEVRIEAEGPLEQAALVAGKYLSPQLYVSYGVGLFEPTNIFRLRYLLSSRWTLQAETGRAAGADALYRIERGR